MERQVPPCLCHSPHLAAPSLPSQASSVLLQAASYRQCRGAGAAGQRPHFLCKWFPGGPRLPLLKPRMSRSVIPLFLSCGLGYPFRHLVPNTTL